MSERVPLLLVAGLPTAATAEVADRLLAAESGTVVIRHDLSRLADGVVRRRVRYAGRDGTSALELAHGCVSCTLRADLLPLVKQFTRLPGVGRIVLHLDPALEPAGVCWAVHHVLVGDAPVIESVEVQAVLTLVDAGTWLSDVTGDVPLAERGLGGGVPDERTVAQVAIGQVEFADGIILCGGAPNAWTGARTNAVLDRLSPTAARTRLDWLDSHALLASIPANARRGRPEDVHEPLLRGEPPLDADCGVSLLLIDERRPFHPERLHEAIDVLLDGVVRARGRVWLASQPDRALWLESAGGGLAVGDGGAWLAAVPSDTWAEIDEERQVRAALCWDDYYGDRAQQLVVLSHRADPDEIRDAFAAALLTDDELAEGMAAWRHYPDPFGSWHRDPCTDDADRTTAETRTEGKSS